MCHAAKISVLMPVHNGMPYLPETVESILCQSFGAFEFLAVDDGSTDGTAQYLKSLQDTRVRYHRLEKVGLVSALNYGLENAQGPLVARIDADDVALPERLERQLAYFEANPRCVLLGCDFDEIDTQGQVVGSNDYRMTSDIALRWQMFFGTPFLHPGVMFPREAALRIGGYSRSCDAAAEDYDMWVRLSGLGPIASLPDRLMRKRTHAACRTEVRMEEGIAISSKIAGEYAQMVCAELDAVAVAELYMFYFNRDPKRCSIERVVDAFQAICDLFPVERRRESPDLAAAVLDMRRRLRRRCLGRLRQSWFSPRRALAWTRAMRGFDPEHGTLSDLTLRMTKKGIGAISRVALRSSAEALPLQKPSVNLD